MNVRSSILALLILAICGLLCFKQPILLRIGTQIERRCAIHTLVSWGLPPTEENLSLYRAMNSEPAISISSAVPNNFEPATNDLFVGQWPFANLWADRPLTIGIYCQDPYDSERFSKAVTVPPDLAAHLRILYLKTERDFLDSLVSHDMVFFCGHANVGRGFYFAADRGGRGILPVGDEIIPMPRRYRKATDAVIGSTSNDILLISRPASALAQFTVKCKVFWCLTCRSDAYFRDMWTNRYPRCHMVTANYMWNPANNTRVLTELLAGLQHRRPLATIIERINAASAADVLLGRVAEIDYGNTTNLSPRLLSLY